MSRINFGVIGLVRWGPNILGSLSRIDDTNIVCISDLNEEALLYVSKRFHAKIPDSKHPLKK